MDSRDRFGSPVPRRPAHLYTQADNARRVKYECVLSSYLFRTSDLWTHQPGSHRRKVTQNFSTFLLRCLPSFLSRKGFSRPYPSSTVKSNIVYPRINRSPLVGARLFFIIGRKNPSSCDCTEIRTPVSRFPAKPPERPA